MSMTWEIRKDFSNRAKRLSLMRASFHSGRASRINHAGRTRRDRPHHIAASPGGRLAFDSGDRSEGWRVAIVGVAAHRKARKLGDHQKACGASRPAEARARYDGVRARQASGARPADLAAFRGGGGALSRGRRMPHALGRDRLSVARHHARHCLIRGLLPQASEPSCIRAVHEFVHGDLRGEEHNRAPAFLAVVSFFTASARHGIAG